MEPQCVIARLDPIMHHLPESAGGGADRPCRAVQQERARGLGRGREENVARVGGKVEAGSDPEPVPRKGSPLMKKRARNMSVFEQIKSGLEDGIAYFRGELSLVTTRLPAPPPETRAKDIVRLRKQLKMSQSVFAATLNISVRTVQSWEQGLRVPGDASQRLLQLFRQEPRLVDLIFAGRFAGSPKHDPGKESITLSRVRA